MTELAQGQILSTGNIYKTFFFFLREQWLRSAHRVEVFKSTSKWNGVVDRVFTRSMLSIVQLCILSHWYPT